MFLTVMVVSVSVTVNYSSIVFRPVSTQWYFNAVVLLVYDVYSISFVKLLKKMVYSRDALPQP